MNTRGIVITVVVLALFLAAVAWLGLVGGLIVGIAAFSIVGVMYIVLQEKHEHEEHYIVPPPSEQNTPQ